MLDRVMKHEAEFKLRNAYAVHQDMLITELEAYEITLQSIGSGELARHPCTMKLEEIDPCLKSAVKRLKYIQKHETLAEYGKLFVQYLYENAMYLLAEDEDSTPYEFEESFDGWGRTQMMRPKDLPAGYKPDPHEQ
jgi:hypothetical protein